MPSFERLSRLAMLPVVPLLVAQGRRLRRQTPGLADAAAPWSGRLELGDPAGADLLKLLVLGDSTAAGVGVDTQLDALPGNLARSLAAHYDRSVEWTAVGENGATTRDLLERFLVPATSTNHDLVFLSIGANDALHIRSRTAFGRDTRTLLMLLRAANPDAVILMASLPAFFRFVTLPNPLRALLYLHSRSLEAEARTAVGEVTGAYMSPPPPPYPEGFFASDDFHPSVIGYREWADFAVKDAIARGQL